jgi:putative transposase
MPRRPRFFEPGLSLHIHQRGNNGDKVFHDDTDRAVFVMELREWSIKYGVAINAWVLMDTHFHLLATPSERDSVPLMMQQTGGRYVPFFNRRWTRTGTLWGGRYSAHGVDNDRYWYSCLRYIEMNPVRANMVGRPGDHRWSSYHAHANGADDHLLTSHRLYDDLGATPLERQSAYRALCEPSLSEVEIASIRRAIRTGLRADELQDQSRLARAS